MLCNSAVNESGKIPPEKLLPQRGAIEKSCKIMHSLCNPLALIAQHDTVSHRELPYFVSLCPITQGAHPSKHCWNPPIEKAPSTSYLKHVTVPHGQTQSCPAQGKLMQVTVKWAESLQTY